MTERDDIMQSLIILSLLFVPFDLFGQGYIDFRNGTSDPDAPVTNAAGSRISGPSPYVADLFWSTNTDALMDNLAAFNMPVAFSSIPGYFGGGGRNGPPIDTLFQVRVWDTTYGSTYYQARDNGGEFGFSNLIVTTPSIPPGPLTPLLGLQGFQLQRLPQLAITLTITNTILFSWPVEVMTYAVQQNPDLSPNNWVTLQNSPITVGQQEQVTVPVPPTGRMFYRLVSQ